MSSPNAGAWLNAISINSLGLKLDNDSFRLGVELARPYTYICGTLEEATHGLDCRRHVRHSAINEIHVVHRAPQAAGVPSLIEPNGLSQDDWKRPDGATIISFNKGKCLVWDVNLAS